MSSGFHGLQVLPVMLQAALLMSDLSYQLLSLWVCNGKNPFSSLLSVSQGERIGVCCGGPRPSMLHLLPATTL